jgi:recombination protein RecA
MARTKQTTSPKKKGKKKAKADSVPRGPGDFINGLVADLEAIGGEGTAQVLGSEARAIKIRGVISTQSRTLDAAIGRGGIPLGRLTILHGKEGSGKTTLCLHLVAETQKRGGVVLYIDKEYKLDPDYAANIGVDIKHLIISQPSYLERVYEIIEATIKKAAAYRKATKKRVPILIILDSMNAAIAKERLEGKVEAKHVAPEARIHSQNLPRIIALLSKEDVALVYVSQYRKKIGVKFGDPNETAGGGAPKYYASLMLKVEYIGKEKEAGEAVASRTRVKCVKNQISPPFKEAEFEIKYGIGIDKVASLLDAAIEAGVVEKSGAWFKHGKLRLGQGRPNVLEFIREDEQVLNDIELALLSGEGVSEPKPRKKVKAKKQKKEDEESEESEESEDEESEESEDEDESDDE